MLKEQFYILGNSLSCFLSKSLMRISKPSSYCSTLNMKLQKAAV